MNELMEWLRSIPWKDIEAAWPYASLVVLWIWKKWVLQIFQYLKHFITLPNTLAKLSSIIEYELKPNGSGSMKDQLTKTIDLLGKLRSRSIVNEERIRILMSQTLIPLWESDLDGKCIWANETFLNILQRPFRDIEGDGWRSYIYQADAEYIIRSWDLAVAEKRGWTATYRMVKMDGTLVKIRTESKVLRSRDDQEITVGYMGIITIIEDNVNRIAQSIHDSV